MATAVPPTSNVPLGPTTLKPKSGKGSFNGRNISQLIPPKENPGQDTAARANVKSTSILAGDPPVEEPPKPIPPDKIAPKEEIKSGLLEQINTIADISTNKGVASASIKIEQPKQEVISFSKETSHLLENGSPEMKDRIRLAANALPNASPEKIKGAWLAMEGSSIAAAVMSTSTGQEVASPLGQVLMVNNHSVCVSPALTIVGDVPPSEEKSAMDEEMNAILDDVLADEDTPEAAKENIESCRKQGKVCSIDPDTTQAMHDEAPSEALMMVKSIGSDKVVDLIREVNNKDKVLAKTGWDEYKKIIEKEICAPETPLTRRNALSETQEAEAKRFGFKPSSKIEKIDLPSCTLKITSTGILFANRPVKNISNLIDEIRQSPQSRQKKSWLMEKIGKGEIEIPTEKDMKEIEKLKKELHLEFLSFMKIWIEKHQEKKKNESAKQKQMPTKGIAPASVRPQKIDIENLTDEIIKELELKLQHSHKKKFEELALQKYWKEKKTEHHKQEELLQKETILKVRYIIQDYIKSLLSKRDYTEEELKKAVLKWLGVD